jgi:hypothetical protein
MPASKWPARVGLIGLIGQIGLIGLIMEAEVVEGAGEEGGECGEQ